MRTFQAFVGFALCVSTTLADKPVTQDDRATATSAARVALGGDSLLTSIRSLTVTGRRTRSTWDSSERIQIFCQLPDKFLVVTDVVGRKSIDDRTTLSNGFNGNTLIQRVNPPGKVSAYGPLPFPSAALQLAANRDEFTLLTLPLFAASFSAFPLRFSAGVPKRIGNTMADAVEVRGSGAYALTLFFDAGTHLPLAISWTSNRPFRLWMEEYRKTDNLNWPHRFRLEDVSSGGLAGDTILQDFKINPAIKPDIFGIGK